MNEFEFIKDILESELCPNCKSHHILTDTVERNTDPKWGDQKIITVVGHCESCALKLKIGFELIGIMTELPDGTAMEVDQ